MFAIITLVSIYFFLTQVKAGGFIASRLVKKSKDKIEKKMIAKAAMVFMAPVVLLMTFKTVAVGSAIAFHKIVDLADLAKSVISLVS